MKFNRIFVWLLLSIFYNLCMALENKTALNRISESKNTILQNMKPASTTTALSEKYNKKIHVI